MPASQVVNFTRTLVVCAPKMFSVTAPPNAAPRPSLFGRCIRITRTMRSDTSTKSARHRLISKFIGTRNMATADAEANAEHLTSKSEGFGVGSWMLDLGRLLDLIPNRVHLRKLDISQLLASHSQLVF